MPIEVPTPRAVFEVPLDGGAHIKVRRHGNSEGVRLFLSHGNGYAIDGYLPYWQHLLADFDVVLFDFRNHGQNVPVVPANHTYAQLCLDLERVFQETTARLGPRTCAGIFHSMSGRTAMKHAIEIGRRFDALILFDPPNVPPPGHATFAAMELFEAKLTDFATNRRRHFPTPDELAADFAESRVGKAWVDGVHELMARAVLRPDPDGDGFVLVCDPANEAGIYAEAMRLDLWPTAEALGGRVKLIGADPTLKGGPPTGRANQALGTENGYDYSFVPGTGHMLQLEKPQECAEVTLAFLRQCGLA